MNTKLLSKVLTWNGDEDQWFEWSFAFRAYCVVSSLISSEDLERAAGSTTSLPLSGQSPEARVRSGTLYYLLVLLRTGKALVILRTVEVGNGVEGWRVLSERYDRRDTTSTTVSCRPRFSRHCQNLSSHTCWSMLNDSPMEQRYEQLSEII